MRDLFDKLDRQLDYLLTWPALLQVISVVAALLLSYWLGQRIRQSQQARHIIERPGFANRVMEAIVIVSGHSAALVLVAALLGFFHVAGQATDVVSLSLQLIGLLLLIRLVVYVLRVSVGDRAPIKGWGTTISLIVWAALSLHVLGWFEPVAQALDSIGMQAGKAHPGGV